MNTLDFMLPASDPQNPNTQLATPAQIARRQAMADALSKEGNNYSPVQSWTQGAARLAQALAGALGTYQNNQDELHGTANEAAKWGLGLGLPAGDMDIRATPGFTSPALQASDAAVDAAQDGAAPSSFSSIRFARVSIWRRSKPRMDVNLMPNFACSVRKKRITDPWARKSD
jgi:hypothetical protein